MQPELAIVTTQLKPPKVSVNTISEEQEDESAPRIQGVFCFLDDILIVSKGSVTKHKKIIDNVLSKLYKEGFALKLSKGEFSKTKLIWLGFEIDETRVRPKHSKIE